MDTFPTPNQEPLLCLEPMPSDEDETLDKPAQTERPKKKTKFRMQGKNFTITFPQCDVPRTTAVERICAKYGDELQGYIVCEELHKDGTPHLHAFLQFKEKQHFRDPNCFDFIGGQHGNYQVTKNIRKWVTYITKEENYTAKGVDVKSIKSKKAPKNEEVAQMIMEGKSLREINEKNPGYVMLNKRKLEEYESWISCERSKKSKIDWIVPKLDGLTGSQLKIAEWICKNIRQQRSFKAPQLFITGTANLGKTSLVEWLEKSLSVYHIPITEEFYDLYSDDYDLVVMDEFKGQKTIQWMNMFLQGSPMNIRKKGSQYMKMKNMPVIILSNYSLGECYPKARDDGRLKTLEARLIEIEVTKFIDFYLPRTDLT